MSFDMSGPLSSGARVREEGHLARVLDRERDELLLLHRDAGDATGADLAALRDELAEGGDVLVVDDADADGLRRSGVLAALDVRALATVSAAAALSCHVICSLEVSRKGSRRCSCR